jgi:hypothetical protein
MSKIDFVPASDIEFAAWHDNFKAAALARQAEAGLTDEDVAQIVSDNAEIHAKIAAANLAAAQHKQATGEKNTSRSRIESNTRGYARRIKVQPKYQPALGSLFGIEGTEVSPDLSNGKPNLTGLDHTGGSVELGFNKLKSDGINIYCQREGDTDWVMLAHAIISPYTDNRPLLQAGKPELRRYTGVYVQKYQEVGQFSDEVVVNCAP